MCCQLGIALPDRGQHDLIGELDDVVSVSAGVIEAGFPLRGSPVVSMILGWWHCQLHSLNTGTNWVNGSDCLVCFLGRVLATRKHLTELT